jgi:hypothetical protein
MADERATIEQIVRAWKFQRGDERGLEGRLVDALDRFVAPIVAERQEQSDLADRCHAAENRVIEELVKVRAERDRLRRDSEPTLLTVENGFQGCTDRNPDVCACGKDDRIWCAACSEEIEDGQEAYFLSFPEHVYLSIDHPDQEWTTVWWHKDCDQRDYVAPPVDHLLATEVGSDGAPF